ncbi:MAG: L-seryl-tRNA(Sec) selenium transferase, partial [Cyanobacteria bacterium]|nr:L-seryl-tRNA(Sec) selenium transferase [Cyanobacteriota bacterium]
MVEKTKSSSFELPQVDKILRHPSLDQYRDSLRKGLLTNLVREELAKRRISIQEGTAENGLHSIESIAETVIETITELQSSGVRRVVNGTGVILNTNLGRAPLPPSILDHLSRVGTGYTSLEIDVRTGKRGERTAMSQRLLSLLTGCQAAIVVNNNASAVLLAVSSLARGKEVIVSRGELIEIGGSFRLPDVITSAGASLREVGTTNRTRISDYRDAINENTVLILRCHRSNFAITGFTEDASLQDLVKLSKESNIPLVEDLGSGALVDLSQFGLKY